LHFSVATLSHVDVQSVEQHWVWSHCPASVPHTQSRTVGWQYFCWTISAHCTPHAVAQQLGSFPQTQISRSGLLHPGVLCDEQQLPMSRGPELPSPPPPSVGVPAASAGTPPSPFVIAFAGEPSIGPCASATALAAPESPAPFTDPILPPCDPLSKSFEAPPVGALPLLPFPQAASIHANGKANAYARGTGAARLNGS
jgi:hypothetical protein